ncbi:MAG TPA: hypothetical protein VJC16_00530 [Candidatus Nanoarchaeia archaeon]|nr:hypothetical protein [Candidatus Nanoarchaeia archaeon]
MKIDATNGVNGSYRAQENVYRPQRKVFVAESGFVSVPENLLGFDVVNAVYTKLAGLGKAVDVRR